MQWISLTRVALALTLLPAGAATAQQFTAVDQQTETIRNLVHEIEEVVVDGDPRQRFRAHRLSRRHGSSRGAVILLHGGESRFDFYLEHPSGNPSRNVAGFLARRGFDVYGYDPRGSFLSVGECTQPGSCAFTAQWGYEAILEDLEYLKRMVARRHETLPVVAGLSRGAMSVVAAIDATPEDYAGAVVWEGMLASDDAAVQALNAPLCDQLEAALAQGVFVDEQTVPGLKALVQLSILAPDDPSPVIPGQTNRQAKFFLLTAPQPSFVPGYTQLAGQADPPRFDFSREDVIDASVLLLNDVIPMDLQRDTICALAGRQTYETNLGSFDGPVLFIESGLGFGPFMGDQAARFTNARVRTLTLPRFGHADTLAARSAPGRVFARIARWLGRAQRARN